MIANREEVECIIDPGSQIVAMSEAVSRRLSLSYDPSVTLHMQSANGDIDRSLGLSRNVPFRIGDLTFYLQVHVICNPAYNVLLGRPFDVLLESTIVNYPNEDQTITLHEPGTGRPLAVPTIGRGRRSLLTRQKFLIGLEDLISNQGEFAICVSTLVAGNDLKIEAYTPLDTSENNTPQIDAYLSLVYKENAKTLKNNFPPLPPLVIQLLSSVFKSEDTPNVISPTAEDILSVFAGKKYKPVAVKAWAVLADVPEKFRIVWNIVGDPLKDIPILSPNPPRFNPRLDTWQSVRRSWMPITQKDSSGQQNAPCCTIS